MGTDKKTELPTYEEYKQQEEQRKKEEEEQRRKDDTIKVTYNDLIRNPSKYKGKGIAINGEFANTEKSTEGYNLLIVREGAYDRFISVLYSDTKYIPMKGTIKGNEEFYLNIEDKLTIVGVFKGVNTESGYPMPIIITKKVYLHNL
jgi:hypothetical protein